MQSFFDAFWKYRGVDWIVALLLFLCALYVGQVMQPFCRPFEWTDEKINRTRSTGDMFPTWSLLPVATLPVAPMIALSLKFPESNGPLEANTWGLIQLQALALNMLVIDSSKIFAGRLRPDFLNRARSLGYFSAQDAPIDDPSLCEESKKSRILRNGRVSFPSGHSGIAFATLVPFAAFLILKLRAFSEGSFWKLILALLPIGLAFTIAISRTRDNMHHFSDIAAGSAIGAVCGLLVLKLHSRTISMLMKTERGSVIEKRAWDNDNMGDAAV